MSRPAKERPRVLAAQVFAVAVVAAIGVLFGLAIADDNPKVLRHGRQRLMRAEKRADRSARELRGVRVELQRARADAARADQRSAALAAENRRLRADLRRARRARGRTPPR